MNGSVLVVEDDPSVAEATGLLLERAGMRVVAAPDGRRALDLFQRQRFDAIVLDIMLPVVDGFDVCRSIRQVSTVPIVMLTARADTTDVVVGLELGADDYVTKPFEMPELMARVRAVLRRSASEPPQPVLTVHDLEVDPAGFSVVKAGQPVQLTATEFKLLLEMARRPGQVFSRELLLQQVWGYDYLGDSRLVDVAVQRLRSKIEADPSRPAIVTTVRGVGYRMEKG